MKIKFQEPNNQVLRKCNKCGLPCPEENDASALDFHAALRLDETIDSFLYALRMIGAEARHILPVFDTYGSKICEGSPSRAQYLENQPRDIRNLVEYKPELTEVYRAAYKKLQSPTRK